MTPETSQRIDTALIWILIVALIAVVSTWQYTSADDDQQRVLPHTNNPPAVTVFESPDKERWVLIEHESDAEYFVRAKAILGFYEPPARAKEQRNEVIMSNRVIYTSMELKQFESLLRALGGVKEVGKAEPDGVP